MKRLRIILSLAALALAPAAFAQYSVSGDDPASAKWYKVETRHFRLIYPTGLDSLSKVYGAELEKYWFAESLSTGLLPGAQYRSKLPVVLHPWYASSNGLVVWAPKRMLLYTVPDPYSPFPEPWPQSLAVHELRHVAQMGSGYKHFFKPFAWVFGDAVPGAVSALYSSIFIHEGDAVVAETALTPTGRGRRADFLSYYRASFFEGDGRDWYQWRYGSYKLYNPNHYALGYLTIAGTRWLYDDPSFVSHYFERISRNPVRFGNLQQTVSHFSGKSFGASINEIFGELAQVWQEDDRARGPFTPAESMVEKPDFYASYTGNVATDDGLYMIKESYIRPTSLVRINKDGEEESIRPFSSSTSKLSESAGKLWWSETVAHPRWSLAGYSTIRYMDLSEKKIHNLTTKTRLFNPVPSADGNMIVAVDYPVEGGTAVVVLASANGQELLRFPAPDSLQVVEPVWIGGKMYVSGVSRAGMGIYTIRPKHFITVVTPTTAGISGLREHDGKLFFASDRTGVDELYSYDPADKKIRQHTVTPAEGNEWQIKGDTLYFSSLTRSGRLPHKTAITDLKSEEVDYSQTHKYIIADAITAQEKALAEAKGAEWAYDTDPEVEFSKPKRWRKLTHIPHVHTWLPLYYSTDEIASLSFDEIADEIGVGATFSFQNHLETAYGDVAYKLSTDSDGRGYRHSAHLNFTYSGLYPVFNLELHYGERDSYQYYRRTYVADGIGISASSEALVYALLDSPNLGGEMHVYIPWNFSSGGWNRGLIPEIEYSFSSDRYSKSYVELSYDANPGDFVSLVRFSGYKPDDNVFLHLITASLRGYVVQSTPESLKYPRLGIGAEVGYRTRVGLSEFYTASGFAYLYGYLPGIGRTQSMRISALYQHQFDGSGEIWGENSVSMRPRGFYGTRANSFIASYADEQLKFTFDYAIPFSLGDLSFLSPLLYVKNFILTPHFDLTQMSLRLTSPTSGNLISAGATLEARLGNLLMIPYDTRIGITYSRNAGSLYDQVSAYTSGIKRNYIGFSLAVDM